MNPSSQNFHGRFLRTNSLTDCAQCHGQNFTGGLSSPSCATCHSAIGVHKAGIVDPASPNFHGKNTLTGQFSNCQSCHGMNFTGGISSPSCATCHSTIGVHKTGINDPSSPNFHGKFIASSQWNLSNCKQCHGTSYAGGTLSPTCLTCHNQTGGPEACNTCHGVFSDPTKIAPNEGSHFAHLYENSFAKNVECDQCHTVPSAFSSAGHIDGTSGTEILFGSLAKTKTNSPGAYNYSSSLPEYAPNPAYNSATGSCSNVYCHGYIKNGNLDNVVSFTATSVACGSCHGDPVSGNPLPKTSAQGGSHPPVQNCAICHTGIVSVSGTTYTIIDKNKHINGKLNVFGNEETY
jgi:predicted CxxxxCH...CXXCH cytochrome family protein